MNLDIREGHLGNYRKKKRVSFKIYANCSTKFWYKSKNQYVTFTEHIGGGGFSFGRKIFSILGRE